ncbi:MAG TPA: glycosyl hydrolase family 8 [Baekduia sp.]|uniref:glycosyl hydrolase family 8 n=1 Tax=Baekduia sp. TaxID=2600305 RepID=UPI002B92862B|nr:glycosyl hydrolase family 8 [Baekduia sp.]HMJ37233.1 glycosyl hydrolase family 8 [Baekduia sp.]
MGGLRQALALVLAVAVAVAAGCGGASRPSSRASPRAAAQAAARAFLDRYVDPDGRVVRRDQGGDTVSEGQAYALLAAVAAGDRARFDRVWAWTQAHLRRADGLLSWHWAGGKIADPEASADADLDVAHALLLGAARFREPPLKAQARRIADAMRAHEIRGGVLLAGPWATQRGIANPSYFDPRGLAALHMDDVAVATRRTVAALVGPGGRTPTDWATVGPPPAPAGPSGGPGAPAYGFDAARLPIRLAASCDPQDRRLAASLRGLERAAPTTHPVFTVARAAQAAAAGDATAAGRLLDDAAEQERRSPTYYGAAWTALGRALLQTDLLGGCPERR